MLDLSTNQKIYEFKWLDGVVHKLNPPTQRLYKAVLSFGNTPVMEADSISKLYSIMREVAELDTGSAIVNMDELPLDVLIALFKDYFTFYTERVKEINFPQSQQMTQK